MNKILKVFIIILFTISCLNQSVFGHNITNNESKIIIKENNQMVNWFEKAKIIALDGSNNDFFGISVSIYENYAVIGARNDDSERGAAYVFFRDNDTWVQIQKLIANDGQADDWFGISVSIFEDYIFVGADADDNENGLNAGAVYVFKYDGYYWNQYDKLLASDGTVNDYFGRYVSIDNNYSIVGAYYDDDIAGSAYIFKNQDNQWIEDDKLIASDRSPGDYFGISASIEGEYAIIGAYRDDNSNGVEAGGVYIFKKTEFGWNEVDKLLASDGETGDRFGISISVDNSSLAIGSYYDDENKGSVYIFNKTIEGWVEKYKLTASDREINNFFGRSLSIYKGCLMIGSWGYNSYSGTVYIFKNINNNWIEENKLLASDSTGNDRFGYQISLHGKFLLIGAYTDDNINGIDAGSAYIFELINNPPNKPSCNYNKENDTLTIFTTDPDNHHIKYGVSWNNSGQVDNWTDYVSSGTEKIIDCQGKKGTVGVIAMDEYGDISDWVYVLSKNNIDVNIFIKLLERFPIFYHLYQEFFYKL